MYKCLREAMLPDPCRTNSDKATSNCIRNNERTRKNEEGKGIAGTPAVPFFVRGWGLQGGVFCDRIIESLQNRTVGRKRGREH